MENLGLDYKLILAQIINFGIVYFIIKKYVAVPFLEYIEREKKIQEEKERVEMLTRQKLEALEKEESGLRRKWREDAKKILKLAQKEASEVKNQIIKDAQHEAGELRKRASKKIEEEKRLIEREIREKIIGLSIDIVEKALRQYMDVQTRKETTQYIMKNFTYKKRRDEN